MEYTTIFVLLSIVLVLTTTTLSRRKPNTTGQPPGPYPFPIIGNIFQLGDKPHQTLANISKTHGPLMSLKLGSITTIVVSSPKFAKEILQKHDSSFSGRTPLDAGDVLDHNDNSIVFLPAGARWKKLRKLCKEQIFATHQLDASQSLRKKIIADLLDYADECCSRGEAMDIGRAGHTTSLNLLSNFLFSIDLARHNSASSQEFKEIIWVLLELGGKPNFADYFPVLKRFDPQGIRRDTTIHMQKLFTIFDRITDQRIQERAAMGNACTNDALDSLLNLHLKEDPDLSRNELRNLFLVSTDSFYSSDYDIYRSEFIMPFIFGLKRTLNK